MRILIIPKNIESFEACYISFVEKMHQVVLVHPICTTSAYRDISRKIYLEGWLKSVLANLDNILGPTVSETLRKPLSKTARLLV